MTDPSAPMRGDLVQIIGGQFRGQMGTLVKRNGSVSIVGLHSGGFTLVRTFDGRLWSVPTTAMLEVTPVCPPAHHVERTE